MEALDPGPFAPLVGYVGALLATAYIIGLLWSGKKARWIGPEENLPDTAGRIVGVISGIGIVQLWLFAEPSTISKVVGIAFIACGIFVVAFLLYWYLTGSQLYKREVAISGTESRNEYLVGGFWLKAQAREIHQKTGETVQEILEKACYNVDAVWSRPSREFAKVILLVLFLTIMVSGTMAISAGGFAIQVQLTGQPASKIIRTKDAPGSETDNGPQRDK